MKASIAVSGHALTRLLASAMIALCSSCATAASDDDAGRTVADGQTFTLQPGERVILPDRSTLRYTEVIADSRCRPDVQCVWAGDAEVAFTRSADGAPAQAFSLHTGRGPRSHDLEGRRLTLSSLARGAEPAAELRVEPIP